MAIHRRVLDCFAALAMTVMVLLAAPASAQAFPKLTGRVVDQADLLRPEQELDISSKSQALEAQSGAQLVVVTVKSLEGLRIEDYSYQLGRHWGIGHEKRDDGVLLLVAPNERKVWIATGYGARIKLTDAVASIIYRQNIIPRFKQGDFAGGITAGVDEIVKVMQLPADQAKRHADQAQATEQRRASGGGGGFPFFLIPFIIFFFVLLPILGSFRRRGRRYRSRHHGGVDPWIILWGLNELGRAAQSSGGWSGGGGFGGGGGFSGGGGSFGGGGAGGSW